MSGLAAPVEMRDRIRDAVKRLGSVSAAAREVGCDRGTVRRYMGDGVTAAREPDWVPAPFSTPVADALPKFDASASSLPIPKHERAPAEAVALGMPDPHGESHEPFRIDTRGQWLILSDIHVPYHDRQTLELAVKEARRRGVAGVILNGDTLDYHEISSHDKDPGAPRYVDEIEKGKALVRWLREQLPDSRIVVKEGNHEERLTRYVLKHAPALYGLECVTTPALIDLAGIGAEWVAERRVVMLGKLPVLHGHEYRGSGGVNPARWLYLRTHYSAICGHFHRTSEHGERNVIQSEQRAWTTGCCCFLFPHYMRLNGWNNGFAFARIATDGTFGVDNKRVRAGEMV